MNQRYKVVQVLLQNFEADLNSLAMDDYKLVHYSVSPSGTVTYVVEKDNGTPVKIRVSKIEKPVQKKA